MQCLRGCAIGVMAKAPRPGRCKTRLCPPLRPEQAARLSAAFLRDMFGIIAAAGRQAPIAGYAALCAGRRGGTVRQRCCRPASACYWLTARRRCRYGVHGFRPLPAARHQGMLALGHAAACVLNSDSPTLPASCLVQAAQALLAPGERIVLGACRRRRLLPAGHAAPACAPVRRYRLEHGQGRRSHPEPRRRTRSGRGGTSGLVRCG